MPRKGCTALLRGMWTLLPPCDCAVAFPALCQMPVSVALPPLRSDCMTTDSVAAQGLREERM